MYCVDIYGIESQLKVGSKNKPTEVGLFVTVWVTFC